MSPRKSSTSSGNPRFDRPRYLLVEAAGAGTLSPRALEGLLGARLAELPEPRPRFRIIRTEGAHALVAVAHTDVGRCRIVWNRPGDASLRTLRSYGTLRKGKSWLADRYGRRPAPSRPVPNAPRR